MRAGCGAGPESGTPPTSLSRRAMYCVRLALSSPAGAALPFDMY
jgi:hypothetical protein